MLKMYRLTIWIMKAPNMSGERCRRDQFGAASSLAPRFVITVLVP